MPSSPIPPVVYGESSGTVALPGSVLTIGRGQRLGQRQQFLPRVQRPGAGQDGDLVAVVEEVGEPLQVLVVRLARRGQVAPRRSGRRGWRDVLPRVGVRVRDLDVVRHGEVGDAAAGVGGADGDVYDGGKLDRVVDHLVVLGHVGVQLVERDFLLVTGAEHRSFLHAGDREHRHVIELGVVQAVEQVNAAGTRGRQAYPDLPGRLGVRGRHEGGGLLVMDQEEADLVLVPAQRFHDPVDPVPGQAEDGVDAPVGQPLDQCFRCDPCHHCLRFLVPCHCPGRTRSNVRSRSDLPTAAREA